jgi:hypothetical protein
MALLLLRPLTPSLVTALLPVLYPFTHFTTLPLYPFTPLPLYPFTPLPLYPFIPLPLYPFTPLPLYPFTPLPLYSLPLPLIEEGKPKTNKHNYIDLGIGTDIDIHSH